MRVKTCFQNILSIGIAICAYDDNKRIVIIHIILADSMEIKLVTGDSVSTIFNEYFKNKGYIEYYKQ